MKNTIIIYVGPFLFLQRCMSMWIAVHERYNFIT